MSKELVEKEFKRERRYIVLKTKDIEDALTDVGLNNLRDVCDAVEGLRTNREKPPLECVVIESDWPEYEIAWKMIQDRMTGKAALSQQDAAHQQMQKLIHVGYTNPNQIGYAKEESGSFYPGTENECYIPLYMLKIHEHRLGHDYTAPPSTAQVSRDDILQCLIATQGMSEGVAADAIWSMIKTPEESDNYATLTAGTKSQPTAQGVDDGMVSVPVELVEFLRGTGELEGLSFGEYYPASESGLKPKFWWRQYLPKASKVE